MSIWNQFPGNRFIAELSLWSADLANLGEDLKRMDPYADLYHIDVADGHFAPQFLFFPDLVARLHQSLAYGSQNLDQTFDCLWSLPGPQQQEVNLHS